MDISFSGKCGLNRNSGINFESHVDGKNVTCIVTREALQGIDLSHKSNSPEEQFQASKHALETIAVRFIRAGRVTDGRVRIGAEDLNS